MEIKPVLVKHIIWDTDEHTKGILPETCSIELPADEIDEDDLDSVSELITDYLSDQYGFTICSFDWEWVD